MHEMRLFIAPTLLGPSSLAWLMTLTRSVLPESFISRAKNPEPSAQLPIQDWCTKSLGYCSAGFTYYGLYTRHLG